MSARKITTGVTLVVLILVLSGMAVYGVRKALAPLPGGDAKTTEKCSDSEKEVKQFLRRDEIQVSVFNAGSRDGLASQTLEKMEGAGFIGGNAGNAPRTSEVRRAVVWTTQPNDSGAKLVAQVLGRGTRVQITEDDLGPGVDVIVGDKFKGLAKKAPDRIRLPRAVETCVEVD